MVSSHEDRMKDLERVRTEANLEKKTTQDELDELRAQQQEFMVEREEEIEAIESMLTRQQELRKMKQLDARVEKLEEGE
jgi:Spy/CpxP family protein refolding chaperone